MLQTTGAWTNWATIATALHLSAGTNRVALQRGPTDSGQLNLDYIAVTKPGEPDPALDGPVANSNNLGGWLRSLDMQNTQVPLKPGLLSRDGWYLLNDSYTALWTDGAWPEARNHKGTYQDGYFFGYGSDYKLGLHEFAQLTGPAPLLPRWAFGPWYSKYHRYSAADYTNIINKFHSASIPLDVLIMDTDYKAPNGWDGWNWNTTLFPEPDAFMDWLTNQGLKVSLNIHPSIAVNDAQHAVTVQTSGGRLSIDGKGNSFDWSHPKQVKAYFNLHQPFEDQGLRNGAAVHQERRIV